MTAHELPARDDQSAGFPQRLGPYDIVDVLGRGGAAVVYRGRDPASGTLAAVKTLRTLDPGDVEGLRREAYTLARLQHPGVVRVLAHGIDAGAPWYAMEFIRGTTLQERWHGGAVGASGPPTVADSLRLLHRLCLTLAFLHGEGVVHRDLKPANVVIQPDGQPVLVDFGLVATFAAHIGREVLEAGGELQGSLSYIAPEQIRGEFVDARADLYALGCMLYEAVTGAPPFVGEAWEVAQHHLETPPTPPSARVPDVAPILEDTILRLLAKQPRQRIGYAIDVARRLAQALGEGGDALPVTPTYLYRASFVGRLEALAQLGACLDRTNEGFPRCVLVAGESGVGKTRLAMEFTREAARRGFTVVTGECVPVEGATAEFRGSPLHALRPLLRLIADHCRQHGVAACDRVLGRRGRVLVAYETAFAGLPGQDRYPAPAPLPAQAARERLLQDLTDTIDAAARERPLVVVLDDLQWADELTLAALDSLRRALHEPARLMLLGTYRSEEESDALRELRAHPEVTSIALGRMDVEAVASIVGDMLAMQPAPPTLVDFLAGESEGNPFFVSEYLRTAVGAGLLARSAAGDWRVAAAADSSGAYRALGLPRSLQALVERRLLDLGAAARALLEAAAVLGRDFAPDLAGALAAVDETAQMDGAAELLAHHVIDSLDGRHWRFAHDKLREVAYAMIDPARRAHLHGAAAAALERRAAGDAQPADQYAVLAHHFSMAGIEDRAIEYLGKAGAYALQTGAPGEARALLGQALERETAAGGRVDRLRRARWLRLLGEAEMGADLEAGLVHTGAAQQLLGYRFPHRTAGWIGVVAAELARQLVDRRRAAPPRARDAQRAPAIEGALAAQQAAFGFYFKFDVLRGVGSSLRCVNLAQRAGEPARAMLPYAQLGYIAGGARLHRLAAYYFARAHALGDAQADPSNYGAGLYFEAMYETGIGRWALAEGLGQQAYDLLTRADNAQEAEVAETILANALYYHGRLDTAEERCGQVMQSAENHAHAQHAAWGLFLRGRSRLALGDLDQALPLITRGYAMLLPTQDFVSLVICEGLLAKARWRAGDRTGATRAADELSARRAARRLVPLVQCVDGYASLAGVRLRALAEAPHSPALRAAARRACGDVRRLAQLFPIVAPAAARTSARLLWVTGRRRRALRAWQRSLHAARTLGMPYEEACALAELSRTDAAASRAAHAEAAAALFARLGCAAHVAEWEADGL